MNRRILLLGISTLIAGAAGRLRARERSPGQSKLSLPSPLKLVSRLPSLRSRIVTTRTLLEAAP